MNENYSLLSLVTGKYYDSTQEACLSLVRKDSSNHAFLILECNENIQNFEDLKGYKKIEGFRALTVHLILNSKSESKAEIMIESLNTETLNELRKKNLVYVSWKLDLNKVERFHNIINEQQKKAEKGEIEYVLSGTQYTIFGGSIGESLHKGGSEQVKSKLESNCTNPSSQILIKKGHNCCSWALDEVIDALNLPFNDQYKPFKPLLVVNPKSIISDHIANKTSRCSIL